MYDTYTKEESSDDKEKNKYICTLNVPQHEYVTFFLCIIIHQTIDD